MYHEDMGVPPNVRTNASYRINICRVADTLMVTKSSNSRISSPTETNVQPTVCVGRSDISAEACDNRANRTR
eukprot:scaffold10248_cov45-Attheya_sp.AAC.5